VNLIGLRSSPQSFVASTLVALAALASSGCAPAQAPSDLAGVSVCWLPPAEVVPHGTAPGAKSRLLATHPDGSKDYALVLANGDEVWSALTAFAVSEKVTAARFTAIGAVHDPEVGHMSPRFLPRRNASRDV
jgi:hypothetical protein